MMVKEEEKGGKGAGEVRFGDRRWKRRSMRRTW